MVGLEYPDINLESQNISYERPYLLLEVASTESRNLLKLFLVKLVANGCIPETECQKIAERGGKLILTAMIECYIVGASYSPNKLGTSTYGTNLG